MVDDDTDYEIVSKKEIGRLKDEIQNLKEGELSGSASSIQSRLNQLLDIFKEASSSLKSEKPFSEELESINEKLNKILDQNQQIAEGILAVADLVKGVPHENKRAFEQKEIPNEESLDQPMFEQPSFEQIPQMPAMPPPPPPMPLRMQQPIQQFPKPQMPSFGFGEQQPIQNIGGLNALPSKPPKRRFSF